MKLYTKSILSVAVLAGMAAISPLIAHAQKFALKPYADIGVGSSMSIKSGFPLISKKTSANAFGLDFGYTFWTKGGNSLEANIGLGYTTAGLKLGTAEFSYSYNAPAEADVDGNPYIRNYTLTAMEQKLNVGYLNIPIYLSYAYQFSHRFAVHADLGFRLGFKCNAKLNSVTGMANSFGVYPEYDDLEFDNPWLNEFGQTDLAEARRGDVKARGFYSSLLVGAALDVFIAGPAWLNVGLRYDCAFSDTFRNVYDGRNFSSSSAPVTYTVTEGQVVKPLSDYFTSSKLSPLSIHVGLTFKF